MPIIFIPTGETRNPKEGEWFLVVDQVKRAWFDREGTEKGTGHDLNAFAIYQRIEVSEEAVKALAHGGNRR